MSPAATEEVVHDGPRPRDDRPCAELVPGSPPSVRRVSNPVPAHPRAVHDEHDVGPRPARIVHVGVHAEQDAARRVDPELLIELPDEGRPRVLSELDLPSREFPQAGERTVRGPADDEDPGAGCQEAERDDAGHVHVPESGSRALNVASGLSTRAPHPSNVGDPSGTAIAERLLAWFDGRRRDLPWRRTKDPYRILVAEFLLQRTRVSTGVPYYDRFIERFPTVASLARASEADVLRTWEGLGFYRRARSLHAAAKAILARHGGAVPADPEDLDRLPGIGPYTAGAVASVAFGRRVPAVDGNAIRVLARVFRIREDVAAAAVRRRIRDIASGLVPDDRPGDFNQALMELGATVCTPAAPACPACPIEDLCVARREGDERSLPRAARPRASVDAPVVFAFVERGDRFLLVRRPEGGLLAGLWSLPGGERPRGADDRSALRALVRAQTGLRIRVGEPCAPVAHAFSHRRWTGAVFRCVPLGTDPPRSQARWARRRDLAELPLVPFHRRALSALGSRRPDTRRAA